MLPKISVIIPVFNTEKYLKECLDSVTNQTFRDIEIICVNDGSTDNSLVILNEYAQKDNRIKIVTKGNGGLASARNEGLKYISGEFVYFLDSDDYIDKTLFEYAINVFNNFEIDFFCFSSDLIIEDKTQSYLDYAGLNNYIKVNRDGFYDTNFDICINTNIHVWNKIYKTDFVKKHDIKFIEPLLYEDIYFVWLANFISKKAYYDNTIYHYYRIREASIMQDVYKEKTYCKAIDHLKNFECLIETLYSRYKAIFIANYNSLLYLLDCYIDKTKETSLAKDKYRVELYKVEILKNLNNKYRKHIVINLFGLKIKFKIRRKG